MNELINISEAGKCIPRSVYVILAEDGLVKIGVTKNIYQRVKNIRNYGHGKVVDYFATEKCKNSYSIEKMIHDGLNEYRISGEWFDIPYKSAVDNVKKIFEIYTDKCKETANDNMKSAYMCNTLLDYFDRKEVKR